MDNGFAKKGGYVCGEQTIVSVILAVLTGAICLFLCLLLFHIIILRVSHGRETIVSPIGFHVPVIAVFLDLLLGIGTRGRYPKYAKALVIIGLLVFLCWAPIIWFLDFGPLPGV